MTGSGLRIALIVSVALNLLVVGAVAGALLSRDGPGRPQDVRLDRDATEAPGAFGPLMRGLDTSQRRELRQRLRTEGRMRDGLLRIRDSRQDLLAALRAQPFSAEALDAALRKQRAAQTELADRGVRGLIGLVADMTDEERAAFADRIEAAMTRRGGRAPR